MCLHKIRPSITLNNSESTYQVKIADQKTRQFEITQDILSESFLSIPCSNPMNKYLTYYSMIRIIEIFGKMFYNSKLST